MHSQRYTYDSGTSCYRSLSLSLPHSSRTLFKCITICNPYHISFHLFFLNNFRLIYFPTQAEFIIMPEVLCLSSMADAEPDLSTFENKTGLAEDMKFLASMPELCDVTFLVGDTREPVCAVKVSTTRKNHTTLPSFTC